MRYVVEFFLGFMGEPVYWAVTDTQTGRFVDGFESYDAATQRAEKLNATAS